MIKQPDGIKRYRSAQHRFLKTVIAAFFKRELPSRLGPILRDKLADELITLFEQQYPPHTRLQPGQLLWNALDKHTRGDSPTRRFVPVVLSLITPGDIEQLAKGAQPPVIAEEAVARMMNEAYQQGGVLSTRDVALMMHRHTSQVSQMRLHYENTHQCSLPHTGALHDMGSTISHKTMIIKKIIMQKKDPASVARECKHSQQAVDRYLKDYNRVKIVYHHNTDITFIHLVTGIAKHVVKQYVALIESENNGTP
jgi:hypothetical protein